MITEITKVTPLIDELRYMEEVLQVLESDKALVAISKKGLREYHFMDEFNKVLVEEIHALVTLKVKELQQQLAKTLNKVN